MSPSPGTSGPDAAAAGDAGAPPRERPWGGLAGRLLDFVAALRRAGLPVTQAEAIEAFSVLGQVELADRGQVRAALRSVLVRRPGQRASFDGLFELYFPARPPDEPGSGPAEGEGADEDLVEVLARGDPVEIRSRARDAVAAVGGVRTPDGAMSYYQYRVHRAVDLQRLLDDLLARDAADDGPRDDLDVRLRRGELAERVGWFEDEVAREVARRSVDRHGIARAAQRLVRAPVEERDLLGMAADDQAELRARIRPLARRLATRTAVRRRRGRRGPLDVRRTVRRSLSTGGVPFSPSFRPRRVHRPELFLLCDVSGSVAAFARFTLLLVHALQHEFSGVRSFAFIDTLDEITDRLHDDDLDVAVAEVLAGADLIRADGRSDYGSALLRFHREHARDVGPRSTLLLLGDARNNYRAPNTWVLDDLRRRARRLYWLNPEPERFWDSGDSLATRFARHVDEMVEVRNLAHLAALVDRVAVERHGPGPVRHR